MHRFKNSRLISSLGSRFAANRFERNTHPESRLLANRFEPHNPGGPYLAGKAQQVKMVASMNKRLGTHRFPALVPLRTTGWTSTPQPVVDDWVTDLETVLGPAAGVGPLVAAWVAGGLDAGKLRSAIRGAVDQRLVFERLVEANVPIGKGVLQQRVVIDDYDNIPGTANKPYSGGNSLPTKKMLANDFLSTDEKAELAKTGEYGANNLDLDLPDYRTATFTKEVKLIKIKPGTTLYRVTDPGGEGGPWWTLNPPKDLAGVIGGTAVMPEWNKFSTVIEAIVPDDGKAFYVWIGLAAAQPLSGKYKEKKNNGYSLPGGTEQLFLPNPTKSNKAFLNSIKDNTIAWKSW